MMGGKRVGRLPRAVGLGREHARHLRERRLRGRHRDRARRSRVRPTFPDALAAPQEVETPGVTTIEALAEFLGIDAAATSKAMPVVEGRRHARARARSRRRPARGAEAARRARQRLPPGDRGRDPRRLRRGAAARSARSASTVEVVADETLREGQFVAGANRTAGISAASRPDATTSRAFADIREPREGDRCPDCGGALGSRPRSRSATSSSSARVLRAARRDVPRRGRQREAARRWAATGSARARDGRGRRAASRRARHRLAGRVAPTTSTSSRSRGAEEMRGEAAALALATRASTSCSTTATSGRARSSRTPTCRLPDAGDGRQEEPRGRQGGRPRPRRLRRGARPVSDVLNWARSVDGETAAIQRRAVRPDDRAPDGRGRVTYRSSPTGRSLGRLSQPPRARQPARCRRTTSSRRSPMRSASRPSTSASTASADHRAARGDARADRPALQASRSRPTGIVSPPGVWRSLVSALVWGTRGPEFESRHPDYRPPGRVVPATLAR